MIKWVGSPNYTVGRQGKKLDRIVVHWIVGKLSAADAVFTKPGTSAHYAVGGDQIHQYVTEENTAYHAGNWDMNLRSIGIEHEGGPDLPISDKTYETSALLIAEIAKRHGIPLDRTHVIGHREVKATQCPGTLDIDRLLALAKKEGSTHADNLTKMLNWDKVSQGLNIDSLDKLGGEKVLEKFKTIEDQLTAERRSASEKEAELQACRDKSQSQDSNVVSSSEPSVSDTNGNSDQIKPDDSGGVLNGSSSNNPSDSTTSQIITISPNQIKSFFNALVGFFKSLIGRR